MNRRRFIQTSAAAMLLSPAGFAFAGTPHHGPPEVLTLYDQRFPGAEAHAASRFGRRNLEAVAGDVTATWCSDLARRSLRAAGIEIRGVTTEPFVFCLDQLMRERGATYLELDRIDRELYAWRLLTRPSQTGEML